MTDAWMSLHYSSIQSLANSDYDAAIDSATQALKLLDVLKAKVLDTCASAHAMKGKFGKAMEIAEKMIQCSPLTAVGYLRAGETLSLQGKHKRAMQLYDQAMEKVPIDDEEYASLEAGKAVSEAQLDKRVDFLTMLPIDIAHIVVDNLGHIDYRIACMDVSKAWRWVVADCGSAWRMLSLLENYLEDAVFRFVPFVGKHIRILKLDHASKGQVQRITELIFHSQLCNIQNLEISSRVLLLMVLTRLGNSLIKLTLKDDTSSKALSMQSILLACPQLEVFYYQNDADMVFIEGNAAMPPPSKLKSLFLSAKSISTPVVEATLRLCPHLKDLYVRSCSGDGLKPIIDHCPRLMKLGFNGILNKEYQLMKGLSGMQQLVIYHTRQLVPQHAIELLKQNQSSLRHVYLALPDQDPNVLERWVGLRNFEGENLKSIIYTQGSLTEMHVTVAAMIRNCRALDSVHFYSLNPIASNVLYEAILSLPNLKALTLANIRNVNTPSLEQFLTAHVNKGSGSSLRKLVLIKCDNVADSIPELIAAIETLQEVGISGCNDFTTDGLVKFGYQLSTRKTLQILSLKRMTNVTDQVLRSLSGTSSLQDLILAKLPRVTGVALEMLVEDVTNLRSVIIIECPQIRLRSKIRIKELVDSRKLQ